jgi:antitoxin component of MazEF toxin-antitoxin module
MYHMRTTIRRLGNSQGGSIPKSVLDESGLATDTDEAHREIDARTMGSISSTLQAMFAP